MESEIEKDLFNIENADIFNMEETYLIWKKGRKENVDCRWLEGL